MNAHAGAQAHFQDVSWNLLAARWFLAGRNVEDKNGTLSVALATRGADSPPHSDLAARRLELSLHARAVARPPATMSGRLRLAAMDRARRREERASGADLLHLQD